MATVDAPAIYSPPLEIEQLPNPRRVLQTARDTLAWWNAREEGPQAWKVDFAARRAAAACTA